MKLEPYVNFCGWVPNNMITQKIREHDFFILPSLYETFGVVFLEALSVGVPIIAYQYNGIVLDLMNVTKAIFPLQNVSSSEIVRALLLLKGKKDLYRQWAEQTKHDILKEFSWEQHAMLYHEALKNIIKDAKSEHSSSY